MIRDLIILGNGPSRYECNYHCEVWGVNGGYAFAKKLDKLFMTDGPDVMVEDISPECLEKLATYGCTLVLASRFSEVTPYYEGVGIKVEVYPIEAVLKKFNTRFFSNTICYMIALALLQTEIAIESSQSSSFQAEPALSSPSLSIPYQSSPVQPNPIQTLPRVVDGYNRLFFFGIDMMTTTSYQQEKGGVEYWMGIAKGMGVEVINTRSSATGKTYNGRMYGWWGRDSEREEKLYAPWEVIKVGKKEIPIEEEWVKSGEDWIKIPYTVKVK